MYDCTEDASEAVADTLSSAGTRMAAREKQAMIQAAKAALRKCFFTQFPFRFFYTSGRKCRIYYIIFQADGQEPDTGNNNLAVALL